MIRRVVLYVESIQEHSKPFDLHHKENYEIIEQVAFKREIINKLNQKDEKIELIKLKNTTVVSTIHKYIIQVRTNNSKISLSKTSFHITWINTTLRMSEVLL